jgi:hypothetical protein
MALDELLVRVFWLPDFLAAFLATAWRFLFAGFGLAFLFVFFLAGMVGSLSPTTGRLIGVHFFYWIAEGLV